MRVDDKQIGELIAESQDLQVDAMRTAKEVRPALRELRHQKDAPTRDPEVIRTFHEERRRVLRNGGMGVGALAARGLLGTAFGSAILGVVARPAAAQAGTSDDLSIQIFQTASSLENLAVQTYGAALQLPFFGDNPTIKTFAETTMQQHKDHSAAFNAQTKDLGGKEQGGTNPSKTTAVEDYIKSPGLGDYAKVVALASTLEEVAQDTYLSNLAMLPKGDQRQLMASVMAVETQHLATLRAVGALLAGGGEALIAIPTDVAKLPAAAGSVAFPQPFETPDMAVSPSDGALK